MQNLKSKDYKPSDIKVQMKKRRKNLGLLINSQAPIPSIIQPNTSAPTINNKWLFLATSSPTSSSIYIQTLEKTATFDYGNVNLFVLTGGTAHNICDSASLYDNQCFFCDANNLVFSFNYLAGTITYLGDNSGTSGSGSAQWSSPEALTISNKGHLHVSDYNNSRVKVYDFGVYAAQAGSTYSLDVDTDAAGNIYTCAPTGYITKTDANMNPLINFNFNVGLCGGMCCNQSAQKLYFTLGSGVPQIYQTNLDGSQNNPFFSAQSGNVGCYSITTDGNLIAVYCEDGAIKIFNIVGNLLNTINFPNPARLKINNNILYILDTVAKTVTLINLTDYSTITSFTPTPNYGVNGLAVDTSGYIYITTPFNNIVKYNSAGELCSIFGSPGSGNGNLNNPQPICFNAFNNQIVVGDCNNFRTQSYNYGELIATYNITIGGVSYAPTQGGMTFDIDGNFLYVIVQNGTISYLVKLDKNGHTISIQTLGKPALHPRKVIYNIDNLLYVSNSDANTKYISVYNLDGSFNSYFTDVFFNETTQIGYWNGFMYFINTGDATVNYARGGCIFSIGANYDSEWQDITKYLFNDQFDLDFTSADSNFSLGKLTIGDITFTVNNEGDKFDFENNPDSLFYDANGLYQRNQSLVRILVSGNEVSRGLIDGKSVTSDENTLSFTANSPFLLLESILSENIISALTNGMKISQKFPRFQSYFAL